MKKSAQRDANTARAGCSKVRTPPRPPVVRPPQTGPITIHCAAMLSAQCNNAAHSVLGGFRGATLPQTLVICKAPLNAMVTTIRFDFDSTAVRRTFDSTSKVSNVIMT